jgi:hypothetical protein
MSELERAFDELWAWCRARQFAGADPFDALNSRLFQRLPVVARSRLARIAWTQAFKRAPVNLRSIALVPTGKNSKGIALFALAALARWRVKRKSDAVSPPRAFNFESEARALLDELLALQLKDFSGACWGYNFDWQSRAFFAPRGTPTIVPTAFAARALLEGCEAFNDARYLETAQSVCQFILKDLQRSCESADEICFSYTPRDCSCVHNASLLAGETLAAVGSLTNQEELLETAARAARFVIRRQRADGAWEYGAAANQTWVDNFHTAFVLMSLARIRRFCAPVLKTEDVESFNETLGRGERFWRENFFLADGAPKYYDNQIYPLDVHSTASAVIALLELHCATRDTETDVHRDASKFIEARAFAEHLARWALMEMRDPQGFFYYQKKKHYTIRTPYMRWAQSWMAWALARLIESRSLRSCFKTQFQPSFFGQF